MNKNNYDMIMKDQCRNSVDYSVLVNNQGQVIIAIEDDNILPKVDSLDNEVAYTVKDTAISYHSFIHISLTIENTDKSAQFTLVICPIGIKSNDGYRFGIESLTKLTYDYHSQRFGQKEAELDLVDKSTADLLTEQNLANNNERKMVSSDSVGYKVKSALPLVTQTFLKVQRTSLTDIYPYKSQYCRFCQLF
jgi:hypothetical protein